MPENSAMLTLSLVAWFFFSMVITPHGMPRTQNLG
jgi:hypothetical protein